jgi:hypothetical protein
MLNQNWHLIDDACYIDVVRLRLWTADTNGSIVHCQVAYEYGEP